MKKSHDKSFYSEEEYTAPSKSKKAVNSKPVMRKAADFDAITEASVESVDYFAKSPNKVKSSYKESSAVTYNAPVISSASDIQISEDKQAELLSSFSGSSKVEIIFSFDTTGSMASCLQQVRNKVSETCERLMKDIPDIRIGVIAHGDYIDDDGNKTLRMVDFCNKSKVNDLVNFVRNVPSTGGGDAPEAYELALHVANKEFSWTDGYSKALVMIGDEVPHPPSYTTENINWKKEVDELSEKDVKIYGIRALNQTRSIPFYEELSERTGTVSIHFNNFHLIVDMFLAICYREAGSEKLEEFKQEVEKDGKLTGEMGKILETLSKANPEKKTREEVNNSKRSLDEWYDLSNDRGSPQYDWNGTRWVTSCNKSGKKGGPYATMGAGTITHGSYSRSAVPRATIGTTHESYSRSAVPSATSTTSKPFWKKMLFL